MSSALMSSELPRPGSPPTGDGLVLRQLAPAVGVEVGRQEGTAPRRAVGVRRRATTGAPSSVIQERRLIWRPSV